MSVLYKPRCELCDKNPQYIITDVPGLSAKMICIQCHRKQLFNCYYAIALRQAFETYPDEYLGDWKSTFMKMLPAIDDGTFNKDGRAFKATCKQLKIKNTYKAIKAYREGE